MIPERLIILTPRRRGLNYYLPTWTEEIKHIVEVVLHHADVTDVDDASCEDHIKLLGFVVHLLREPASDSFQRAEVAVPLRYLVYVVTLTDNLHLVVGFEDLWHKFTVARPHF